MNEEKKNSFLCFILFYVCMNANRSIDMGHILKYYFIRDAKLSIESHLYILKRMYQC